MNFILSSIVYLILLTVYSHIEYIIDYLVILLDKKVISIGISIYDD